MSEQEMRELFAHADEASEPALGLTPAGLVAAGRRVHRRRIAVAPAVAGIVVVGVTVAAAAATGGSAAHHRRGSPAVTASPAPAWFDPLVRRIDLGYLPDGLGAGRVYDLSTTVQQIRAGDPGPATPGRQVAVTVGAPGVTLPDQRDAAVEPATPIDGHAAVWVVSRQVTGQEIRPGERSPSPRQRTIPVTVPELRWQYAANAWAEVKVSGYGDARDQAARTLATEVAGTVRFDLREPVRLPYQVTGIPGLHPASTTVALEGSTWDTWLSFSDTPDAMDPDTGQARELRLHVGSVASRQPRATPPNTVVDGHQAALENQKGDSSLAVYDVQGVDVGIDALRPPIVQALGPGGVVALYHRITLVTDPGDTATWTAQPVR
ncbi:MAG: hypothetical protein ACJ73S_31305 [Mycobacteriales bacterium]